MATQLADRYPNPDLWSDKFGLRPTIGPAHFFEHGTHGHAVERSISQIAVETFFFGLQLDFGLQKR